MSAVVSAERRCRLSLALVLAIGVASCAPRTVQVALPGGQGQPMTDAALGAQVDALTAPCRDLAALTADLRIAGRVDGERVRGTLQVGVEAGGVRLEGVPPFGAPVFILAGRVGDATLLFPRDGVFVSNVPVAALIEAVVGVALTPPDLLALLGGCGISAGSPTGARAFGSGWARLDFPDEVTMWLRQEGASAPALRVADTRHWRVDYEIPRPGQPVRGVLTRKGGATTALSFEVSAPERLSALPEAAFDVTVPADARALPLEHFRRQRVLAES